MSNTYIKKSWKGLPLELINALVFLSPVCFPFLYDVSGVVLVLLIIYTLSVLAIAIQVLFVLRSKAYITISDQGIGVEDKTFFEWEAIESYSIAEERKEYFSAETGRGHTVERKLCLHLKNATLVQVPIGNLDKNPNQITALLEQKRSRLP